MDNVTRDGMRSLIGAREDFALRQLDRNLEYQQVCERQDKSEKTVDELFERFEKEERITICRHYEGDVEKTNYEIKAAYIQGLRDCFRLFGFLSGNEVQI